MHQVTNVALSSQTSSSGYVAPSFDSHETLTTQNNGLTSLLHFVLPSLSTITLATITLANSSNIACRAQSSQLWLLDSSASSHISGNSSLFHSLHPPPIILFLQIGHLNRSMGWVHFTTPPLYLYPLVSMSLTLSLICCQLIN